MSISSESNHSPLFSSGASSVLILNIAFLKNAPFLSFHEQTLGLAGVMCF